VDPAFPVPEGNEEIEIRRVFQAEDFGANLTPELRAQEARSASAPPANTDQPATRQPATRQFTSKRKLPMQTSTHLHFNGNCREAFDFYARTFGRQDRVLDDLRRVPCRGADLRRRSRDKIIHARVDFGGQYLLGLRHVGEHYHTPQGFT